MSTASVARVGIPLRPDPTARDREQRQSVIRAFTSFAFHSEDRSAEQYQAASWPNDHLAATIIRAVTKAAVVPMTIAESGLPEVVALNVLPIIAPLSAAVRMFARCLRVSLDGVSLVSMLRAVPGAAPIFIAEGAPVPVIKLRSTLATIGPPKKILVDTAVTNQLEKSGPEAASDIFGRALSASVTLGLDGPVFDDAPADAARPAGLLFGLTAIPASAETGLAGIAADLGNLAGAVAGAGVGSDDMIFVTSSRQAMQLKTLVGPQFDNAVFGTPMVPDKRVIGIAPAAVCSGYAGVPSVEKKSNPAIHFDDSDPTNIGMAGSPNVVAAPVQSAFQNDLTVVRVRCKATWSVVAPGVAFIDGASW